MSCYDANEAARADEVAALLAAGLNVALVSEAGTPLLSDPGFRVVAAAIAAGARVVPVPGPSAVLAALVGAGLPTDRFLFLGFPPRKSGARRRLFAGRARPAVHAGALRIAAARRRDARRPGGGPGRRPPRLPRARAHQTVRGVRARHARRARRALPRDAPARRGDAGHRRRARRRNRRGARRRGAWSACRGASRRGHVRARRRRSSWRRSPAARVARSTPWSLPPARAKLRPTTVDRY